MKTGVAFVALFAGANAFVPATSSIRTASTVAAGLEGMIGVGPETGNKIVSLSPFCVLFLKSTEIKIT